jgi:hypothetical protein
MWDLYGVDISATGPVLNVVYLCGPTFAGSRPELEKRRVLWASPIVRVWGYERQSATRLSKGLTLVSQRGISEETLLFLASSPVRRPGSSHCCLAYRIMLLCCSSHPTLTWW